MLAKITLITGGQRSGKSRYAQDMALSLSETPVYLATARVLDNDFKLRVKKHKEERDERWENIEEDKSPGQIDLAGRIVVFDCLTLWLTNLFMDYDQDIEKVLTLARNEWQNIMKQETHVIVVTNEIGMGGHSDNDISRKFTDLQGSMNQHVASMASEVFFMVSGIAQQIK